MAHSKQKANDRSEDDEKRKDKPVIVALIGAAALIIGSIITMISPPVQEWLKNLFSPKAQVQTIPPGPPPSAPTKKTYCNDPRTGQPYKYDIPSFYPKKYTDLNKPFGGDAANPGHLFNVKSQAPGFVLSAACRHDGTSEEITYCGPDREAKGQPTKTAEIEGWINGEGGPTYMTVFYQLACEEPVNAK